MVDRNPDAEDQCGTVEAARSMGGQTLRAILARLADQGLVSTKERRSRRDRCEHVARVTGAGA